MKNRPRCEPGSDRTRVHGRALPRAFCRGEKLMVQHFDALVVDCDNEQNAALLFKSARNSGSNQASLAVAVVEDRPAWPRPSAWARIWCSPNPFMWSSPKVRLRVARGLLRKDRRPSQLSPARRAQLRLCFRNHLFRRLFCRRNLSQHLRPPALQLLCWTRNLHPSLTLWTRALLEYMPDSPLQARRVRRLVAAESDPSKQYPWQPRKPMAEPMASGSAPGREAAGSPSLMLPLHVPRPRFRSANPQIGFAVGKTGAAAAPCPCQGNSGARCQGPRFGANGKRDIGAYQHPPIEETSEERRGQADRGSLRER